MAIFENKKKKGKYLTDSFENKKKRKISYTPGHIGGNM
jgi:hypothetical protein